MNKKNLKSFLIGALITIFIVVGVGAVMYTAWRMNQPGPVAPTVPQIKPHAEGISTPACTLNFTVAATPSAGLTCDSITMSPNNQTITSILETRTLTASSSGGVGNITYTWTTSAGGILSPSVGKTTTWTAPSSFNNSSQNWKISVTVSDNTGQTVTGDACVVQLSYNTGCNASCFSNKDCPSDLVCSTGKCRNNSCVSRSDCKCPPLPKVCNDTCLKTEECGSGLICAGGNCRNSTCITQPSCTCPPPSTPVPPPPPVPKCNSTCTNSGDCPTGMACVGGKCRNPSCSTITSCICLPPVQTHKSCSSNHTCVTVTGAGTDTCTSDASCQPLAVPPPIPKSGIELPTILTIVGGVALLAIGLLVL